MIYIIAVFCNGKIIYSSCFIVFLYFPFSFRSSDLGDVPEDEEEEDMEDDILTTNSPEPPEPVEPDDEMQADEYGQLGRLHPEQDLPHIFKV